MKKIVVLVGLFLSLLGGKISFAQQAFTISVTSTNTAITTTQPATIVTIRENSASPSAEYFITLPGSAVAQDYAAGIQYQFIAPPNSPWPSGTTIGFIRSSGAGPYTFVAVQGSGQSPPSGQATTKGNGTAAPAGAAGGDLSGSYPSPTVAAVNGAAIPASASVLGSNSSSQPIAAQSITMPLINSVVVLTPATAGTNWTDKVVTAYGSARCASGCTIEIPDSVADNGSATTPSVPANVTLMFTGTASFTFCTLTMNSTTTSSSHIYSPSRATLTESGASCPGVSYAGTGPQLGSLDHPVISGIIVNCASQATSTGVTLNLSNGALYELDTVDVTGCTTVGILANNVQFSSFTYLHLEQNYVNFKLYATGAGSSNIWNHNVMASPSSGVDMIIWNSSTTQNATGNIILNSTMQNGSVVALAVIGNSTCGSGCTSVTLIGGSPELDGGGASSVTIDGNVISRAGALFSSNANATWYSADIQDATATPEFLLNNSSTLVLHDPSGYGNSAGTIISTDATSAGYVYGSNMLYSLATLCGGSGVCGYNPINKVGGALAAATINNGNNPITLNFTAPGGTAFLQIANTTPATSSVSQSSPYLNICGQFWTGSASLADCFRIYDGLNNGTNGAAQLNIAHGSGTSGFTGVNLVSMGLAATTLTSNVSTGTPPLSVTSTTPVSNLTLKTPAQSSFVASTTPVTSSNPTINTDQALIQLSIGAGFLNALAPVTITGSGIYSSTTASTPALTFKIKLCTVSGCGSGTVVTLANIVTTALNTTALTNATWNLVLTCVTSATGSTGNLMCHGAPGLTLDTGATLSAPDTVFADTNTAILSNIDLTAALFVQFTIAQSVVGSSNSYTQQLAAIR